MGEQLRFLWRELPNLLWGFPSNRPGGLVLSVIMTFVALAVGFALAVGASSLLRSGVPGVSSTTARIVWVFRSVPLIVMLLLGHQVLGSGMLGPSTTPFMSALIVLSLYAAAYLTDVVHAGRSGVPESAIHTAQLLGAGRLHRFRTVTLPWSLQIMRPALGTQAITVFKDSSVVVVLGVAELTTSARIALDANVGSAPFWLATYLLVGGLYWLVSFAIGRGFARPSSVSLAGR